ncbi:MAG: hypothetical protein ACPG4U_15050 [Pseudomonadales bacterium]
MVNTVVSCSRLIAFIGFMLSAACVNAQRYLVEVPPAGLFAQPSENAAKVVTFYRASDIDILEIREKWAQVSFTHEGERVTGWLLKTRLQLQQAPQIGATKQQKNAQNQLKTSSASVKAINSDLHCIESAAVQLEGCVVDVDVEIKADQHARYAQVSCRVEFELIYSDLSRERREISKRLRTPLKAGVGAARVQLALLPLSDKKMNKINKIAHSCDLEDVL